MTSKMESAGGFKTTLPLANDSDSPEETETLLVPAAPAQFPGSFAPDARDDHRTVPRAAGWKRIRVYFTDGWDDVQLWKSAVSLLLVLLRASYTDILSRDTVHRVHRVDLFVLPFSHDNNHNYQLEHYTNRSIRGSHQHLSSVALHKRTGTCIWWSYQSNHYLCNVTRWTHWIFKRISVFDWTDSRSCPRWWSHKRELGSSEDRSVSITFRFLYSKVSFPSSSPKAKTVTVFMVEDVISTRI